MSVSPELMYAILAMDSYNRGYDEGITGLGGLGSQIGTATILNDSENSTATKDEAQAAGFYAVEYLWNGETVISYRGTDQNFSFPFWSDSGSDLWNGYGTGIGSPMNDQAHLAAEFFQAVTNTQTSDPQAGLATLTGHSLGGGLAGLIGALYHNEAVMFDNMPFEAAAKDAHAKALGWVTSPIDLIGKALWQDFYNETSSPWAPLIGANLQGWAVTGEFLAAGRGLQTTPVTSLESHTSLVDPFSLHSQALLTMLLFARQENHTDWESFGEALNAAWFDDGVGEQAGFEGEGSKGRYSPAYKQLSALAYSAIDEGTMVFGNTGIRALFEDANEVGQLMDEGKAPLGYTSALNLERALAKSIVQFAGQMALGKVDYQLHSDVEPEKGFLRQDASGRLLQADLTKELWTLNDAGGENADREVEVLGIHSMLQDFLAGGSFADRAGPIVLAGMEHLYGDKTISDARVINRIDFVLGADPVDVEITDLETGTDTSDPKTAGLLVALDGTDDRLRGNQHNNILLGKGGQDQLYGGAGKDLLIGGAGDDTLYGGSGEDWLHGGDKVATGGDFGEDTVDYSEGDNGAPTPGGITLTFDLSQGVELEGHTSLVVTNDGYGDTDHLFAIETIKGTAQDDMVVVTGGDEVFQASSYALSTGHLEVDGQGGKNTVDFTNYTGQVYTREADGGMRRERTRMAA